jgi:Cytochrome c3
MRIVRWLLPLLSLLAVLWFTWRDVREDRSGPGPLHSAHATVAELRQGANCEACHRPGAGIDADGCVRCHAAIGAQRASGRGLHGRLPREVLNRCERCHGEHHGDQVPLLAPHAFARAGVADPLAYDHAHVDYGLTGVHLALGCERCHPHAQAVAPPAPGRFLGLQQQCPSCHQDVHREAFGGDCNRCHGQQRPWPEAPGFQHASFPLRQAHAAVRCDTCHAPGSERAVDAELRQTAAVRACSDCHADPHGSVAAPVALRLADTADCARCHDASQWSAARPDAARHARLGFALNGPHAAVACAACHGDADQAPRWSAAAPAPAACAQCHAQPHGAPLLAAAVAAVGPADGCAGCHLDTDADFAAGRLSAEQHRWTGVALVAPHAEVACAGCHRGATPADRFPGRAMADCRACHVDVHGGQFEGRADYGQCTACHATTHFVPPAFGLAAHAATAFPLTGAHAATACQSCHREVGSKGRVFAGTTADCRGCHADVHRGEFDRPGRPLRIGERAGCARCHDTDTFAKVVGDFAHATWTGYELVGAHARLACGACHPPAPAPGPRLGPAAGRDCAACHQDPHAGQFAVAGATDCTRCHGADSWRELRFDHGTTRFPLDATHRNVACAGCHRGYQQDGHTIVRYRPLGTACGDCHRLGAGEKR